MVPTETRERAASARTVIFSTLSSASRPTAAFKILSTLARLRLCLGVRCMSLPNMNVCSYSLDSRSERVHRCEREQVLTFGTPHLEVPSGAHSRSRIRLRRGVDGVDASGAAE